MGCNAVPSPAPATGLRLPRTISTSTARKFPCVLIGKRRCISSSTGRYSASAATTAGSEGVAEEDRETQTAGSSARTQLDLLEQLASSKTSGYETDTSPPRKTIREQLAEIVENRYGDFTLPLGKKLKASMNSLTISQKRNIKRQSYLNEVSQRNDSVFFATIGAFVILPPLVILAVAVITGYVQLLP